MKLLILIFLFTLQVHAEDLLQQAQLVRATIQQSLLEIRNIRSEGSDYKHADFEEIKKVLLPQVENQLVRFEADYQKNVIEPVKRVVTNYKGVEANSTLTAEEKTQLLDDLFKSVQVRANRTVKEFKAQQIPQLLALISGYEQIKNLNQTEFQDVLKKPRTIDDMKRNYETCIEHMLKYYDQKNAESCNFGGSYSSTTSGFQFIYTDFFRGCWTRGCQSLLMLTYKGVLDLVQKLDTVQQLSLSPTRPAIIFASSHSSEIQDMANKLKAVYDFFGDKELSLTLTETELANIHIFLQKISRVSSEQSCKKMVTEEFSTVCKNDSQLCHNPIFRIMLAKEITPGVYTEIETDKVKIQKKITRLEQDLKNLDKEYDDLPSLFLFDSKRESLRERINQAFESKQELSHQYNRLRISFNSLSRIHCFLSQEMP